MSDNIIPRLSSDNIGEIAAALAKAQSQMKALTQSKRADIPTKSGRMSYGYATLADVIRFVTPILSAQDIAFTQQTLPAPKGTLWIVTTLMHSSGQWLSSHLQMAVANDDARVLGSAMTYACRYSLRAICGLAIVGEDDDGAAASKGVDTDDSPLADHPADAAYLLAKAKEFFGDAKAESVLESLAVRRFRIADGDWRLIPKNRLTYAIEALDKKAEATSA